MNKSMRLSEHFTLGEVCKKTTKWLMATSAPRITEGR